MSSIDEIKARIDIVDLVSETVQLRRSGKSYTGFCPFHSNTRTPAFVVFPETGTWRCFGQCNEGGDIFGYVMKKEGWDFSETLHYLAEKAGVQLKPQAPQDQAAAEAYETLRALLEDAVTFYRHQLFNTPAGKSALDYLHQRGLKDETIEAFGLGYAPNSWEAASGYFKSKRYSQDELLAVGLVSERDQPGGVYDRFRHRIMFPIRDERGRMAGFGARILNPEDVPKFLNSPQTVLFDKGRLLYGLDLARKAIRAQDQAVIVEGYLDVIALHQAGFANVVSPMGTALTEHQLYLLKRFTRRIVLALDPDAAGDKATLRGLQIARQALDHEAELVFDARGLLSHEARLQADIRVTTLPPGMDPDDVVNRDPKEWERILADAKPIVIHVMETLVATRDLDDPKVKEEIAAQVLPLIEDVPSSIERDTYRQRLARLIRVDERALLGERGMRRLRSNEARFRRPTRRLPGDRTPTGEAENTSRSGRLSKQVESNYAKEAHALGILLRQPELLYKVDRALQAAGLGRLSADFFQYADHKMIFHLLQESIDQDVADPLRFVMISLSLPMMELADELLRRTSKLDTTDNRVVEDLVKRLLDLHERNLHQSLDHFRFLMEDAQQQGDLKDSHYLQIASQYQQIMVQHIELLRRVERALG
jgi:DNA primase